MRPEFNPEGDLPKERWIDRNKVWFEVTGIFAGVARIYLLVVQTVEMVKSNKATQESLQLTRALFDLSREQLIDARVQQRAWLQIENIKVEWTPDVALVIPSSEGNYGLEVSFVIRNAGGSMAKDILGTGFGVFDGNTNGGIKKWANENRVPTPSPGGNVLLPQQTTKMGAFVGPWPVDKGGYIEQWVSYRDVFGRSNVAGFTGHYDAQNSEFSVAHIYQRDNADYGQTNR